MSCEYCKIRRTDRTFAVATEQAAAAAVAATAMALQWLQHLADEKQMRSHKPTQMNVLGVANITPAAIVMKLFVQYWIWCCTFFFEAKCRRCRCDVISNAVLSKMQQLRLRGLESCCNAAIGGQPPPSAIELQLHGGSTPPSTICCCSCIGG